MKPALTEISICIFAAICIFGCQPTVDSSQTHIRANDLIGHWLSTKIVYPKDPIFKNTPPDTSQGSAKLQLQQNGLFVFKWNDTNITGNYMVDGKNLILASKNNGEKTSCHFHLDGNNLIIEMDDGFKFEFKKSGEHE